MTALYAISPVGAGTEGEREADATLSARVELELHRTDAVKNPLDSLALAEPHHRSVSGWKRAVTRSSTGAPVVTREASADRAWLSLPPMPQSVRVDFGLASHDDDILDLARGVG